MSTSLRSSDFRRASGLFVLLELALAAGCASNPPVVHHPSEPIVTSAPKSLEETNTTTFITSLSKGDFKHTVTPFDADMTSAMPPDALSALWQKWVDAGGAFQAVDRVQVSRKDAYQIAVATVRFERLRKDIRVVFDEKGAIAGLFFGPVPEEIEAKTKGLVEAAARGDFTAASRDFGAVMKNALPPAKLADVWSSVEKSAGKMQSVDKVEIKPEQGAWVSLAKTKFERGELNVKVVYDIRNEVVGLFVLPPEVAWAPPSYVETAKFDERAVKVGDSPELPGYLTVPKGDGPFPAVVLVHGSGPNDADESVGGVRVFKDLAWGLSSQGIAVLRYDKRTRVSPAHVVTEKEEVMDGAHDAIELLRKTKGIDPTKIFVLGHSQGGGLAPRIAKENPTVRGFVVLAGPTRTLQDIIIAQFDYITSLEPKSPATEHMVADAEAFKKVIEDPKLGPDQDVSLPTGGTVKAAYFIGMRGYEPATVAASLPVRMLVLQGERDYQVTLEDFAGWKKALTPKHNATLKTYPALNHLFVSGVGKSTPAEYAATAHVDPQVVSDIATWVKKNE